ncbi:MAG TPA: hypothetical protein VKB56_03360 [Terriglobales bacterium]|nr:hypothetical protein [Terriglobales bacterium]
MDLQELQHRRDEKWHLDGNPVRTLDAARDFLEDVGLCLMYPVALSSPAPTFIAAWLGRADRLLSQRPAFSDPEAAEAEDMKLRLLREHAAYEWRFADSVLLIAASVFPYFYALASDREGRQQPAWAAGQKLSKLARDTWAEFQRVRQPLSEQTLRQQVGKGVTESALNRALHELSQRLRIMRVDRSPAGDVWDSVGHGSARKIKESEQLSVPSALSALISKYLDAVIAAGQNDIETFFSPLVSLSKVRDALNALLAAREVTTTQIGTHTMLQITPPKAPAAPRIATPSISRETRATDTRKPGRRPHMPRRSDA